MTSIAPRPALILIPGWGADRHTWSALVPLLSQHFTLCFIDLKFENGSESQGVDALVDRLAAMLPDASMVLGWSLGGMLATQIAARYPHKISRLCLLACNLKFVADDTWPHAMPQQTFDDFCNSFSNAPLKTAKRFCALQAQGDDRRKFVQKSLIERCLLNDENAIQGRALLNVLADIDNREVLFGLPQPVLSVYGDGDALVPLAAAEAVAELALYGECSLSVVVMASGGHAFHISQPDELNNKIVEFFTVVNGGSANVNSVTNSKNNPFYKDKRRIEESFGKASGSYDGVAHLQLNVARQLCKWAPDLGGKVLDLGCGTGYCLQQFSTRSNVDTLYGLDIARPMLRAAAGKFEQDDSLNMHWCQADMESLPIVDGSFDTVVSSLAVQWCDDFTACLAEVQRVLKPGGHFLVSSLGPETLSELSGAWFEADPDHVHVNQFTDAEKAMASAAELGLELQLFATDFQTLRYRQVTDLMRELKAIGAHNVNRGGNAGLTGKYSLRRMLSEYEKQRMSDDYLPATYEVLYWLFKKVMPR